MQMGAHFAPPLKCPLAKASGSLATLGMTAAGSRFAHARKTPSLLVLDVHILSVNHAFILLLARAVRAGRRALTIGRARARCSLRSLVHLLRQLVGRRSQPLARRVHLRLIAAFDGLLRVRQSVLHVAALRPR